MVIWARGGGRIFFKARGYGRGVSLGIVGGGGGGVCFSPFLRAKERKSINHGRLRRQASAQVPMRKKTPSRPFPTSG